MGLGGLIGLTPGLIALMKAAAGGSYWRREKGSMAGVLFLRLYVGPGWTGARAIINFLMISVLKKHGLW